MEKAKGTGCYLGTHQKEDCCGCAVCVSACAVDAIKMKADDEGFSYPVIDKEKCIFCQKCEAACPNASGMLESQFARFSQVLAVKHKNDDVRMNSTSGGAFTALSDVILHKGGVIWAACSDNDMMIRHQRAASAAERNRMRGSIYVQSATDGIYPLMESDLKTGNPVLFVGTPCQCAAVHSNFSSVYSNVYVCDLLCHAVASPLLWRDHIERLSKRGKIQSYTGRSKAFGWGVHTEEVVYTDGRQDNTSVISQEHQYIFYSHIASRPSCYVCRYTSPHRPSDITIGDLRGPGQEEFKDRKGVSVVLINTEKGRQLLDQAKKDIDFCELLDENEYMQACLCRNISMPSERQQAWEGYKKHGYRYMADHYGRCSATARLKRRVRIILGI